MILQLNTEFLLKNKITANQFLLLHSLLESGNYVFKRMVNSFPEMQQEVNDLVSKGLLNKTGKHTYTVTEDYKSIISGDDLFKEFLDIFPTYAERPDGKREYLKTDINRAKSKYNKIVNGRLDIHNHIMQCLQNELKVKKNSPTGFAYMRRVFNWLNAETWKEYEDVNLENITVIDNTYGTELE